MKYGVTRDYVLGLRAVTGAGESIRTGCRTSKPSPATDCWNFARAWTAKAPAACGPRANRCRTRLSKLRRSKLTRMWSCLFRRCPVLSIFLDGLGTRHQLPIVSFGHAGNGNLHVNLMVHPDDASEMARTEQCLNQLMEKVLGLGGTLSGEHGIGAEKRRFVTQGIDPATLALMRRIKQQFDPHALLNPGKLLPND